ncbi:hypothetical protein CFOL_v3_32229 [Cephalotus follicularis]|uniref:Uncharacterized protein n=1 Tax=Cephalotus follicularis TaxID=3775 RepID=A0A1Q3D983_CEPFO|nr:hypothetical protein CFOL_v3_32229 [Cephalotus follicularis]
MPRICPAGVGCYTLSEWGQNPHCYKQFTTSFDLPIYNYFDYIDAWKHAFLFQNIENRHSWFFCFDKTFRKQTIPYWFVDWWCIYGPIDEILPPSIEEAFDTFTKNIESITICPTMLSFFIHCKLSWIMYWIMSLKNILRWYPDFIKNFGQNGGTNMIFLNALLKPFCDC